MRQLQELEVVQGLRQLILDFLQDSNVHASNLALVLGKLSKLTQDCAIVQLLVNALNYSKEEVGLPLVQELAQELVL